MNHWEGDTFFVQTYRQHQGQEPMVIERAYQQWTADDCLDKSYSRGLTASCSIHDKPPSCCRHKNAFLYKKT